MTFAGNTLPVKSRPPTYQRRISRTRIRDELFLWKPGERVDGPPRVTRKHFVSEALDDRRG
jgi:hypothetical protein